MFVGGLDQVVETEISLFVSTTEIAGANLPDQVTPLEVMGGDASFAGVVQAAGQATAGVEGMDSVSTE